MLAEASQQKDATAEDAYAGDRQKLDGVPVGSLHGRRGRLHGVETLGAALGVRPGNAREPERYGEDGGGELH